jgi:hypothetical protein
MQDAPCATNRIFSGHARPPSNLGIISLSLYRPQDLGDMIRGLLRVLQQI